MKALNEILKYDPVPPLLECGNEAIAYFTRRDILNQRVPAVRSLWELEEPSAILSRQKPEGFWKSRNGNREKAPAVNYDLFETFKAYSKLIDMYEFNYKHESIKRASEYLFSCQTDEGDIRGIIGEQYAPYYTGLIISLLIKAGYESDPRVEKAIKWLSKMRQNDGGWVIGSPGCFGHYPKKEYAKLSTHFVGTRQDFNYSKPFTHSGTGMVLRAYAAHPKYRKSEVALKAAKLLKGNFFKSDNSSSYKHRDNWINFKYPFFWTDLISALDSLSLMGFPKEERDVEKALTWLIDNQTETGLWRNTYSRNHKNNQNKAALAAGLWVSLAICRIFKRLFQ